MITRVFKKEELLELDLPEECIWQEIIENDRWAIISRGVFKYEDKHYMVTWRRGSTEYQDEAPWEYEEEIKAIEVELRDVSIKKWVEV